jgi:hypothetical protein
VGAWLAIDWRPAAVVSMTAGEAYLAKDPTPTSGFQAPWRQICSSGDSTLTQARLVAH